MYNFIFVDDEDFIRELFSDLLDWNSYSFSLVEIFSNADEALTYVQKHPDNVHVILSDIKMGSFSGLDLAARIKEINPNILIVLISGHKDFDYAFKAIKINVFDYLLKPLSYQQFHELFVNLKQFLDQNTKTSSPITEEQYFDNLIHLAKEYIKDNLQTEIRLTDIAEYIHMNPTYFSRYFKKHTGVKLIDYISRSRVELAIKLLANPSLKIYEICEMVGYRNVQHFYNVFKQYTGITPTEYRKQHGGDNIS